MQPCTRLQLLNAINIKIYRGVVPRVHNLKKNSVGDFKSSNFAKVEKLLAIKISDLKIRFQEVVDPSCGARFICKC